MGVRMKLLVQFTRILLLYFGCEALVRLLVLPVPGALLGMLALTAFLCLGIIRTEHVEDACRLFLRDMALFFIPPAVGILASFHHLRGNVLAFVCVVAVSTVLVFAVTAFVTGALIRRAENAVGRARR
ncbi:MAG: CidA/LrgA family protein [Puniceicoccales bacterium]|jgi:holin-like protein|nr:CidA/LrgA family protein [Puniceicoccales bacterium]